MTLKINNTPSWGIVPFTITNYLDEPRSTPEFSKIFCSLTTIFATMIPKGMTYLSTTKLFCNHVAKTIHDYDNDDRLVSISAICKEIWSNVIVAEDRILQLLNDEDFIFTNMRTIETHLYRSLIDTALSPFTNRFLDLLVNYLKTIKFPLYITEGPPRAFIQHFEGQKPLLWVHVEIPKFYTCYEDEQGDRFFQIASLEEVFLHEVLHHLNGHTSFGYHTILLGRIWTSWNEREVIDGSRWNGSALEFSDKAFALSKGWAVRIGHFCVSRDLSPKQRFLHSVLYGITKEVAKWLSISNSRVFAIKRKMTKLTSVEGIQLFQRAKDIGKLRAYMEFFHPFSKKFNINTISLAQYNAVLQDLRHWPVSSSVERESIGAIQRNQLIIDRWISVARRHAESIKPSTFWRDLAAKVPQQSVTPSL